MKRRDAYLKLTRHNGRAGTHGTYNPKHNDRSFNLANGEHIDPERAKGNIYWDCFHGFRSTIAPQDPDDLAATFSEIERQFYESRYSNFVESQNERNAKIRHTERNRSIPDLLSSRKTCPEETIYQLGTLDEHASAEDLLNIVTEFIEEFKGKFGEHVHVLDWALHLDESTPHIHERHVFDCENKYGEVAPQQEKALEALGFDLPDPDKPLSRRNNRKITFDAACRKMLFEIAKRHGLELEEKAEYGNRKYLEKQDFILAKQKEQLTAQQNKLDELTLKVNDMEALIDDVSAAAYNKAVEVVTDAVRTETRKEDMRMIEDTKKWVLSPERKAPKATREYTAKHLDGVLNKFLKTMQTASARLQEALLKPEVRQKGKEQVKEKARDSVLQLLFRLQAEQQLQNGIPCFLLDLFFALLPDFRLQQSFLQTGRSGLHRLEELVQNTVQMLSGVLPCSFRRFTFRGQHPLFRVLDHPHIFLPGLRSDSICHDFHRLVIGCCRNIIDQRFHVVDLEGQFVQLVLLGGKLLLLLGKDEVLLFQIFAVAVFCFFLQFQPVPLGNLEQHLSTGGVKGDFAVVPAAEGLIRVGQIEA